MFAHRRNLIRTALATALMIGALALSAVFTATTYAQSVDPVAPSVDVTAEPSVLGASTEASIDPVDLGSVDGVVLGASTDAPEEQVPPEAEDEMWLDAFDDTYEDPEIFEDEVEDVVGDTSLDPVVGTADTAADLLRATAALNVRVSPSVATERLGVAFPGMTATVIEGPVEFDGMKWLKVIFETGLSGWSAANWLE